MRWAAGSERRDEERATCLRNSYLRLVLLARRVSFARGWWQQKLVKSIHTDPREFAIYGKYVACQTLRVP